MSDEKRRWRKLDPTRILRALRCAPETFRTEPLETRTAGLASWGTVSFGEGRRMQSKFIKLAQHPPAGESMETYALRIARLMMLHWRTKRPQMVISVIGGAASLGMTPELEEKLASGLVRAAVTIGAWVITGGTDSGVMSKMGAVFSNDKQQAALPVEERVALIGVLPWGAVDHGSSGADPSIMDEVNPLEGIRGGSVLMPPQRTRTAPVKVPLEPNHTMFIGVDSKPNDNGLFWGAEVDVREHLEATLKKFTGWDGLILVVIGGGPFTIKKTLSDARKGNAVLLLSDTGGAAELLSAYFGLSGDHDGRIEELAKDYESWGVLFNALKDGANGDLIAAEAAGPICSWSLSDAKPLEGAMRDAINQKHIFRQGGVHNVMFRLRLAIGWNQASDAADAMVQADKETLSLALSFAKELHEDGEKRTEIIVMLAEVIRDNHFKWKERKERFKFKPGYDKNVQGLRKELSKLVSLSGLDFEGADLAGRDFNGLDLRGCKFVDCNLRGAMFVDADVRRVNFTGANLNQAVFYNARHAGAAPHHAQRTANAEPPPCAGARAPYGMPRASKAPSSTPPPSTATRRRSAARRHAALGGAGARAWSPRPS